MNPILIVDDSPVVRRVMSMTLERNGYFVMTAENGIEAKEIIEDVDFDLIFCDLLMPEMNGLELLTELRTDYSIQDLPIVILTASGERHDYEVALGNGANHVMTKPASSSEILSVVNDLAYSPVPA